MKRVPYEKFGEVRLVPHRTWTNNKEDKPAKDHWDRTMWMERGECWYGLMSCPEKTVLVVDRRDWLTSPLAD